MEWFVQIRGESFDLRELSKSLDLPELRVTQEGQAFILKSTEFNLLKDADDVRNRAIEIVSLINGAARLALEMPKPLAVDHVVKVNDDGTHESFFTGSGGITMGGSGILSFVAADGTVQEIHQADPIPVWVATARHDTNVAKVLRLLGAGTYDWVNLYRIYEVIESDVKGISNIVKKGWATKRAIKRFKHTANSPAITENDSRHGKETKRPPRDPMALAEAKSLVKTIIHNWLRSKRKSLSRIP